MLTEAVGGIGLALKRTRDQGHNIAGIAEENYSSAESYSSVASVPASESKPETTLEECSSAKKQVVHNYYDPVTISNA